MPDVPAISVVMPVYNAARFLRTAVGSILGQTRGDFELVAVDDGSTDASRAILESCAERDRRVRVISRPNTGIVGALNDGVAAARGALIARMDADDVAYPRRLDAQAAWMAAHPEAVAAGSAVDLLDRGGARVQVLPRSAEHARIEAALLRGDGGAIIHPAAMFRRSAVEAVGGYRTAAQWVEDLDLYLRLARVGRLGNLAEVLLGYRVHPSSANFARHPGRDEARLAVLAEAHRARGLPFDAAGVPPLAWGDAAERHREWAVTALPLSGRLTAVKHGLCACRAEPRNPASWRSLRYALSARTRGAVR